MKINLNVSKRGDAKILVSHSDMDGIGAVVVLFAKYGNKLNWYCCEYGNVNQRVHEILDYLVEHDIDPVGIDFVIADISVDPPTAERLHGFVMNGMKLRLYDHHVSAEHLRAYPWAIVDITECGTTLVYRHELEPFAAAFDDFKANRIVTTIKELAYTVKDYDLWIHEDPRSAKLNRLLTVLGRDALIDRLIKNPSVDLSELETVLVAMDEDRENRYFAKVYKSMKFFKDAQGRKYGVGLCDQYTSNVAARILQDITINYVALIDALGQKVSLRSKFIDVARVAEKHGGGGHKLASGYSLDYPYVEEIAETLYK